MNRAIAACALVMMTLAWVGALRAHHSVSMFDLGSPSWIKGMVTRYEPVNPHILIGLEARSADGRVQRWTMEGPSPSRLKRLGVSGDLVKPGDVLEVCAFSFKKEFEKQRQAGEPGFVHGHLLVMPDGRMRIWGSYGKLENCIRPGDQPSTWAAFVNADSSGHDAWCNSPGFATVPSLAPKRFVEEVNRRMSRPCQ